MTLGRADEMTDKKTTVVVNGETVTVRTEDVQEEVPARRAEGWFLLMLLGVGAVGWVWNFLGF